MPPASRLQFRPQGLSGELIAFDGPLGLVDDSGKDGVLYVPETAERNAPPMLWLHGATGTGRRHLKAVLAAADRYGVVLLAPDSRGPTWDVIVSQFGGFGPDIAFFERALAALDERVAVDWSRLAISGVSDGASYALSVGVTNGDLFPNIVAFSPGFVIGGQLVGLPRVYVSHGTADPILPIDMCSRQFVPAMREAGYDVTFDEFDGGHTVPPEVSDRAFAWWLNPTAAS